MHWLLLGLVHELYQEGGGVRLVGRGAGYSMYDWRRWWAAPCFDGCTV